MTNDPLTPGQQIQAHLIECRDLIYTDDAGIDKCVTGLKTMLSTSDVWLPQVSAEMEWSDADWGTFVVRVVDAIVAALSGMKDTAITALNAAAAMVQ